MPYTRSHLRNEESSQAERSTPTDSERIIEALLRRLETPVTPTVTQVTNDQLLRNFKALQPPTYDGLGDPSLSDTWVQEVEEIFDGMGCGELDRKRLAVYQLKGGAKDWWKQEVQTVGSSEAGTMGWDEFKTRFLNNYFSDIEKNRKSEEFLALEQRSMTVFEYQQKFNALSRFAPYLIDTREKKVWRFINGLQSNIRKWMLGHSKESYEDVVQLAKSLEMDNQKTRQERESRNPSKASSSQPPRPNNQQHSHKRKFSEHQKSEEAKGGISCHYCGRHGHTQEECRKRLREQSNEPPKCFNCGEVGHFFRNCPQIQVCVIFKVWG